MIKSISEIAKSAPELETLLEIAREYAAVYLMAKKRQKGCDGMGELAMVKEEFRGAIDNLFHHCKGKGFLPKNSNYDLEGIATELSDIRQFQ